MKGREGEGMGRKTASPSVCICRSCTRLLTRVGRRDRRESERKQLNCPACHATVPWTDALSGVALACHLGRGNGLVGRRVSCVVDRHWSNWEVPAGAPHHAEGPRAEIQDATTSSLLITDQRV